MTEIPFCGEAYKDRTPDANVQECINLYPMRSPSADNQNRLVLYPTPGYSLAKDIMTLGIGGAGQIRAMLEINNVLYFISGSRLVKATNPDDSATISAIGILNTSLGRCSMITNTVEIIISDGQFGYTFNLTTSAFTVISGGGWPSNGVTNFSYMDGYTLAAQNNSSKLIQSDLLAGGTYGSTAFANVTSFPDTIKYVYSDQLQLYAMSSKLTEVRANAGSIPFAFEKVQGVLLQAGTLAPESVVKVGTTMMWLATDSLGKAYVAALNGYQIQVLSTPPINEAIERYPTITDAFAYAYREADNQFYCITFPSANVTWVYDTKMGMWHQRSVNGGRDLPDYCISFQGRNLVGDSSGKLYWMSQEYSTDGSGNGLRRVRTCQHISAGGKPTMLKELQINYEAGVGLLSGQGSDPLATLEISRDGGNTWVTAGILPMGKLGEYRQRMIWRRLGWAWTWTFRLTITDPVRTYITGASGEFTAARK